MLPCLSFRTVVSRKLTELVDIWCVNFIEGATLFRVVNELYIYIYIYIYIYLVFTKSVDSNFRAF